MYSLPVVFQHVVRREPVQEPFVVGDDDKLEVGLLASISDDPACQRLAFRQ
jgi:hypothetical protein